MAENLKRELTKEEREQAVAWLNKHWIGGKHCGVCGHRNWALGGHVVSPSNVTGGGFFLGGAIYPVIPVTCLNCGNTHFFNAIVMGIFKKEEQPPKEQPPAAPKEGGDV
jgi:hypothetical protein